LPEATEETALTPRKEGGVDRAETATEGSFNPWKSFLSSSEEAPTCKEGEEEEAAEEDAMGAESRKQEAEAEAEGAV
jgi:hypothetical protein